MPQGRFPLLELTQITKAFGGVEALRGIDFALSPGEIHGLVGENGAGKSTLMKIIAGVHPEFSGRFMLDGRETRFRSTRDARASGSRGLANVPGGEPSVDELFQVFDLAREHGPTATAKKLLDAAAR